MWPNTLTGLTAGGISSRPAGSLPLPTQVLGYDYLMTPPTDPKVGPRTATVGMAQDGKPLFRPFSEHWLGDAAPALGAPPSRTPSGASWEEFLFHDHYIWHSARPRPKQGTVEVRPACQQPLTEHMVVSALGLGLVQAQDQLAPFIADFARTEPAYAAAAEGAWGLRAAWPVLLALHKQAGLVGLADNRVAAFSKGILELSAAGLGERGMGEEKYLEPLFARIEARENPSQVARRLFAANGGDMEALVKHFAVRK